MIRLNTLRPSHGANRKKKRVGRGPGSGHGKTACRGSNGQLSRSGSSMRAGFEGGQMPLYRRLPKRGFCNIFKKRFALVNLDQLADFPAGTVIDVQVLKEKGIVRRVFDGVKLLGNGEVKNALTVRLNGYSKSAAEKIAKAGGAAEVIK
jgi:large subunit ribosomal protein L15